ncbi:Uncharacterised protein [Mycobacterium tuberculosis]|nr:Uncharacterised protein [Mycobacterium tuberculosis]CNN61243.1 Uncharacterised protein [Mycobacterium tuberculosis]COW98181.1 Uncharacterised protein [Mycobacterium tuberculosis]
MDATVSPPHPTSASPRSPLPAQYSVAAASPWPLRRPRPPTGNGIRWPAASRAATGRSTPATVTSVACSSLKAPGPHMVAASSPRRLSWPAGSSRLPSVSGCWPPRVAAPGRCAAAGYRTQHPAKCFPLRQRWTLRWTRPRSTANQHRWPRRPPTRRHPWNLPLTTCPHRWVNPSRQLPPTRHHPPTWHHPRPPTSRHPWNLP